MTDENLTGVELAQMAIALKKLAAYQALGTVEELAALKKRTRWIPVSERMPRREMCCLVYQSAFVGFVDTAHYYPDTKQFYVGGYPRSNIDYWMPLPEAPKEADHEK